MVHFQTQAEMHKALLEAAQASKRLNDQVHAGEHASATLAALAPTPAPGPGVPTPSPFGEPKR